MLIKTLLLAFAGVLLLYVLAMGWLWLRQERLMFFPEPLPADHRFELSSDVRELTVDVPGARLSVLQLRRPQPDAVVFYLHGNAGNLASWFVDPDFYRALNVDLVMLDYRGYGKSTGQIQSEAQLLADARAVWDAVADQYPGVKRIFFGRSLGTGLVTQLAASLPPEQRPDSLVLVSPYLSFEAMTRLHYPYVPTALLRYPLRSDLALAELARTGPTRPTGPRCMQVVLLHGDQDDLIPHQHSAALAALSPHFRYEPIVGAGHNDLQLFASYLRAVTQAVQQTIAAPRLQACQP